MMQKFVDLIDRTNDMIGKAMGWVMAALVALVTFDVVSRYLFNTGWVVVQELEWWLFSIIFLMAAGYTFLYRDHVRVDIIYSRLPNKWKHAVDIFGALFFLFPMCALVIISSYRFIAASWRLGEVSPDPGGLPALYLLKAVIPLGFFFLALQGVSELYKSIQKIRHPELNEDQ